MRVTLRATERGNKLLYIDRNQNSGGDEDVQARIIPIAVPAE